MVVIVVNVAKVIEVSVAVALRTRRNRRIQEIKRMVGYRVTMQRWINEDKSMNDQWTDEYEEII